MEDVGKNVEKICFERDLKEYNGEGVDCTYLSGDRDSSLTCKHSNKTSHSLTEREEAFDFEEEQCTVE
jgi:UDP-2,3-diacylglucosamine pyrophosphatase LpxH